MLIYNRYVKDIKIYFITLDKAKYNSLVA